MSEPIVEHSVENTRIIISGRSVDLGDAIKQHIDENVKIAVQKYFGREASVEVTFAHANTGQKFSCNIHMHAGKNVFYEGKAENGSARNAFDQAMTHIAKQLRRHKREVREDKHRGKNITALDQALTV